MAVLEAVPTEFIAGDTWRWLRDLPDYPSPTWVVTYYFENKDASFNAVATQSGTKHSVTIASGTTALLIPGDYRWFAKAVGGGITETVPDENGWLTVIADPAASGNVDRRTIAQKLLDAVNATLLGRATLDQLSMSIGSRSLSRMSPVELDDWRARLERQVQAEKQGSAAGLGRNINVRFA